MNFKILLMGLSLAPVMAVASASVTTCRTSNATYVYAGQVATIQAYGSMHYLVEATGPYWRATLLCNDIDGHCVGFELGAVEAHGKIELSQNNPIGLTIGGNHFFDCK